MKSERGFTVIELLIFFVVLVVLGGFFFFQKADLEAIHSDQQNKTAINNFYHALTKVYYPEHQYYPSNIDADTLPTVNPEMFKDAFGFVVNEDGSDYHYEGIDCTSDGQCQSFRLTADMSKEAEYVKTPAE
jgi:Tfp pilus assembly protein PilE